MTTRPGRYDAVAIVLHWTMAAAILANLALGFWMHEAIDQPGQQATAVNAFQLHKSIGLLVLALSLVRLGWRLAKPPPAVLPMPVWQQKAASFTHGLFYFLMIALPLSGWLYVSTQWRQGAALSVPTLWFGLFEVPHLFGLNEAAQSVRENWAGYGLSAHQYLAWSATGLLVLHVGAAIKHQFANRDGGLSRMLPVPGSRFWPTFGGGPKVLFAVATLVIGTGLGAIGWALLFGGGNPGQMQQTDSGIASSVNDWMIIPARSHIRFRGTHAGAEFQGRFTRWQAGIIFAPDGTRPESLTATIQTASATDGVPLHDSTLKEAEWFNVARYPEARFTSQDIKPLDSGGYEVSGSLQIKDRTVEPIMLRMNAARDKVIIEGEVVLDRAAVDLGMESDPGGQWVSKEIPVTVRAEFVLK